MKGVPFVNKITDHKRLQMLTNVYKRLQILTNDYKYLKTSRSVSESLFCDMEKKIPFVDNQIYHVYNRCNGYEAIFKNFRNYDYFLMKFHEYLDPHWETLAWCLMPTHFHLMIRMKPQLEVEPRVLRKMQPCVKAYADFCNGYVQAFNREHGRKGSLFMRSFKRIHVSNETYERQLICYIHNNPVKEGYVSSAKDWHHSSFRMFSDMTAEEVKKNEIITKFGSKADFLHAHVAEICPGSLDIKHETFERHEKPGESVYNLMDTSRLTNPSNQDDMKQAG